MHNFYWGYPWEGHLYLRALVVGYICETLSLSDIVESRWWVGKLLGVCCFYQHHWYHMQLTGIGMQNQLLKWSSSVLLCKLLPSQAPSLPTTRGSSQLTTQATVYYFLPIPPSSNKRVHAWHYSGDMQFSAFGSKQDTFIFSLSA